MVTGLLTMTGFILVFRWFPPTGLFVFIPGSVCAIILNAVRLFRSEETKNKELAAALEQYKTTHTA